MTTEVLNRTYTLEEFFELDLPEEDGPYELIRGEIVPKKQQQQRQPGPSKEHGSIISILDYYLQAHAGIGATNRLGTVFSGAACIIPGANYLIPDLCFLKADRVPTDPDDNLPYPDVAIEVVSKSDIWFKVREKVEDFIAAGTSMVWVIFWPDYLVFVYEPGAKQPTVLFLNNELDGGSVIPGFKLAVSKLFE